MPEQRHPVPVRTILAVIGLVLATAVALQLVVLLARVEALILVAAFFAVVLTPPVNFLSRRLHLPRGLATLVVVLVGLAVLSGLMYAFIRPLVVQTGHFADRFPEYLSQAQSGRGPVGRLVTRYELDRRLEENLPRIRESASRLGGGALEVARSVASGVVALVTILVLAILMILSGPELLESGLGMLSPPTRERVRAVGADCAKAVTGYVFGNLVISVVAGTVSYIALAAFGVPFKEVLALWVGFADLIPLVGATLGAIPAVLVAFLHSTKAGVGMIVVYLVYQQFENHVLQVVVMSKTVQLNTLFVMVSVLAGIELFGILGALLAIPVAGVIQVIVRDLWDHRAGRMKEEPTIGGDEVPVSEVKEARAAEKADAEGDERRAPAAVGGGEGRALPPAVASDAGPRSAGDGDDRERLPAGDKEA